MALLPRLILSHLIYLTSSIDSDCNFNINTGGACTPLTILEKQAILDLHNELRDRVAGGGLIPEGHPAATNMNSLIWDDGLANVAQMHLEKSCEPNENVDRKFSIKYERDEGNTKWGIPNGTTFNAFDCGSPSWSSTDETCIPIGENLMDNRDYPIWGISYNLSSILTQIEAGWWNEYTVWTYGMTSAGCNSTTEHTSCGHYTQMAWANTRYVGCGYVNGCSNVGWIWDGIFVCNYFPVGNFNGASYPPYTAATSNNECSDCDRDRTECKSMYVSQSTTAGSYADQPYEALCDGGACPTMCDGSTSSVLAPDYCNMCTPTPSNIDCTDGTVSITAGRDICTRTNATPAPVTPSPVTPAPVTPAPITPSPTTPSPVTPAPVTPSPVTPSPTTPAPVTPSPVTPAPVTPSPVTPAPVTPSPITPAPSTPAPVTPTPTTPSPILYPNCSWKKKYATTWSGVGKTWTKWYDAKVNKGRNAFLAEYPGCHTGDASSLEFFYQFLYDENARTLTFYAQFCCGTDKQFGSDYRVTWVQSGY
eukprot:1012430_1